MVNFSAAKNIYDIVKERYDTRTKLIEKTMVARSPDAILKEIATERVHKIL